MEQNPQKQEDANPQKQEDQNPQKQEEQDAQKHVEQNQPRSTNHNIELPRTNQNQQLFIQKNKSQNPQDQNRSQNTKPYQQIVGNQSMDKIFEQTPPRTNIEIQKRSSDSKQLFFKNKNGEELKKKDDMPAQKSLVISIPNKDISQISKESHLRSSSSDVLEPAQKTAMPRVVKRQETSTKEVDIEMKKDYDVDELKSYEAQSIESRRIRSRGFVTLQNYLLEMKNEKSGKSQYGYIKAQRSRSKQNMANLVVLGKSSMSEGNDIQDKTFVPIVMLKKVDMWDDESEEEFKMKVNQSFNRLTKDKIKLVLDELIPHIKTPEREKLVADIFVNKASSEKSFASIYAEFVKELPKSHSTLAQNIINAAADRLDDYALNPPDEQNDYECESSIGYATFVAALISNGQIEDGEKYLKNIIEYIPESSINPTLIEMLKSFVISVGQAFIQKVDKIIFEKLRQLSEKKDIQSRVHYLIIDTLEIINGINVEEEAIQKVSESSKSLVRSGFASFQEDYTRIPDEVESMQSIVFFEGSMILFPDIKDIYDFTYYQCFVIKKKKYRKQEIIEMCQKYIRSFAEQQIYMDVRYIWVNISTLLCQMVLHGVINPNDAQILHRQIYYPNSGDSWNLFNDLKFFIKDNIDFTESFEVPNYRDYEMQEIGDALRMPDTIKNPNNKEIKKVSRLIVIAVIRSVFAQFKNGNEMEVSGLSPWKSILSSVYKKCEKEFTEILDEEFKEYEFDFAQDDVISFINT